MWRITWRPWRIVTKPLGGWLTTRYQKSIDKTGEILWMVGWRLRYHQWPRGIPPPDARCR